MGDGATQVDNKVLQSLQKSFLQVQSILDQNRLLINEINQNHESKIPENLNNNIQRVVGLYDDLSLSFSKSMETSPERDTKRKLNQKRARPGQ
ncbi:Early flowering [Musa troglodytarum]|uniref:Early flowering n=1 Tax=Musa troglodytarum TaxID=320322 RepID=A0A9E7KV38_9LILI|nr:Early flowering [Musa troglodytarum]